jgi:hypothetical protein
MTDVEINCKCAELVGMKPILTDPGAYWDEFLRRTRLIPGSSMFETRRKLGYNNGKDFVFDVFSNEADLMRVERKLGIESITPMERVAAVAKRMGL